MDQHIIHASSNTGAKMALAAYTTEYGDVHQLTDIQIDLARKVVEVLGCTKEITKSVSTEAASTSLLILFAQALRLTLEKNDDSDKGVRTMKAGILATLNRHHGNVETNTLLTVGTLLDLCFKDKFFSKSDTKTKTLEIINSKLLEINTDEYGVVTVPSPSPKRPRQSEGIWNCFNEIIENFCTCVLGDTGATEIEQYLKEPTFIKKISF